MRRTSLAVLALALPVIAGTACEEESGPVLRVDGVVLEQGTGIPIELADVEIWFDGGLFGDGPEFLAEAYTDAAGSFSVTVPNPPGYASSNCSVMDIRVQKSGYSEMHVSLTLLSDDPSLDCSSGGAISVTVRLDPLP